MRKVVLYTLMSLDGAVDEPARYFSPQEDSGPPVFDAELDEGEAEVIGAQDVVLLGRRMYDEWSGFWPNVDDNPFADFINEVKKYVATSTPLASTWNNAEAIEGEVEGFVRQLKDSSGGDIGIHGSIELAQSLLAADLVDELRLVVAPAVGFGGRRLFENTTGISRFELVSARPTSTGSVMLTYQVRAR
ncbi:dihydrofolate reductase family protein [Nocardioides marmorisolisilvae]|uniref:Dihydrofolate reductase n=1 Tax=Nocardioides marmorisolisilvae TaxID=1542737 RepID=A0A3N0DI91_9ACTN|nr:dihydrofolate reductase family protein [Nocardioides marmorisolisilvae]RNL75375.1 dihydrofolate reductase [Nocardioides marmorisolisilvae]